MPPVRPRPKPKAKRRAQIAESNAGRDQRLGAVRALYSLAEEISLPGHRVNAKAARNEDVERLVRLLEARLSSTDGMARLRAAAQMFTDNGSSFTSPVLGVDVTTPAAVDRHRVLLPSFRLKPKAFMLTYNGPAITIMNVRTICCSAPSFKRNFASGGQKFLQHGEYMC